MKAVMINLFLLLLLLVACDDPNLEEPAIEDLGMVGVMGFDYEDEENVRVTVTLPQPRHDAEEQEQIYSTVVKLPHQAIMDVSTLTEKVLTTTQLRVVLFSEEFARRVGVRKLIENLYRDPHVGTNVYIAVVKGSVEEMLNGEYNDKPEINNYLNELLTPRIMTAFNPFTTIHDFIFRNTDNVSDPSVPYLEIIGGDSVKITHVALFRGDKMVDKIDPEEAKLIGAMKKRKKLPDFAIMIPGEEQEEEMLILKFVETRYDVKANGDLNNPEIYVHLYIRGSIVDYDGFRDLSDVDTRQNIEDKISEQLEHKLIMVIERLQELQVDPFGLGESFRIKEPYNWSKERWNESFSRAEITTHIEVRIISTGTIK